MIIIVKIIIFPCIVMAYYQLSIAVPWIILTPFRLLLYFIPKIRRSLSESTEIDLFIFKPFIIIFLALFLFSHFYWSLWNKPLIHLWASPLLIASLYLHSTLVVSQVASYNPFVRQSSGIVLLLIIPITAVLFVGYFTKNIISITMVKWAIPLGVIVAFIDQLIILLKFPSDFREIKRLTQRLMKSDNGYKLSRSFLPYLVNLLWDPKMLQLSTLFNHVMIKLCQFKGKDSRRPKIIF